MGINSFGGLCCKESRNFSSKCALLQSPRSPPRVFFYIWTEMVNTVGTLASPLGLPAHGWCAGKPCGAPSPCHHNPPPVILSVHHNHRLLYTNVKRTRAGYEHNKSTESTKKYPLTTNVQVTCLYAALGATGDHHCVRRPAPWSHLDPYRQRSIWLQAPYGVLNWFWCWTDLEDASLLLLGDCGPVIHCHPC